MPQHQLFPMMIDELHQGEVADGVTECKGEEALRSLSAISIYQPLYRLQGRVVVESSMNVTADAR